MSITDNVINIALLGTANREMTSGELPEDLAGTLERVKENATDGEEVFYKGLRLFRLSIVRVWNPLKVKKILFQFQRLGRKCGLYVGQKAAAILSILLGEKYANMLLFWYRKAAERETVDSAGIFAPMC